MSTSINPSLTPEQVSCSICRKEIPLSAALTPQVEDYVVYFCGLECFEEYVAEQNSDKPKDPQK